MSKYAILVDAGFLKHKINDSKQPISEITIEAATSLIQGAVELSQSTLYRIYYYDSPPLEKSLINPINTELYARYMPEKTAQRKQLLHKLSKLPYYAIRKGDIVDRGWELDKRVFIKSKDGCLTIKANDIKPNLQQKGVDMRIGLDKASLSLKKLVDTVVLVTSDSDFIPAMKFARREGLNLHLVTFGHNGIKEEMYAHTDILIDINLTENSI